MIPALQQAAKDRRLTGHDQEVLTIVVTELSAEEYRPVRCAHIGAQLGVDHVTVASSLSRLAEAGYLERRGTTGKGLVRSYRLGPQMRIPENVSG